MVVVQCTSILTPEAPPSTRVHGLMLVPQQCYEVAKTPRQPPPSSKTKDNSKSKSKGKEKEQASRPTVLYDYHDGSVHDEVVRAHFQRGYEGFKVRHTSVELIGRDAITMLCGISCCMAPSPQCCRISVSRHLSYN